jgi:hypothetical protein
MNSNFDFSSISSFGCVVVTEEIPHLYIMDEKELLDGIPFFDDSEIYTTLDENEIIVVGIIVKDAEGIDDVSVRDINDNNYDELTYVVTPLKFHTLKTPGLINDDIMDLEFFDILVGSLIDGYLTNLGMN